MTRFLLAYIRFVLRHRAIAVVGLVLVSAVAVVQLSQANIATSLTALFMDEDNPLYLRYRDNVRQFGSDNVIVVGVEGRNPLEPRNLAALERIHETVEGMPDVARVTSVATLNRVISEGDSTSVTEVADEVRDHPERADALARELAEDETTGGLLISRDARSFVVLVELTYDEGRPVERSTEILEDIFATFKREGFKPDELHRAGLIATISEVNHSALFNVQKLFPFVMLLLLIAVFVMFGHLWPVMITTLTAVITVLWTMAFAVFLEPNLHILTTIIPCVILIIAFSDLVHLISAYLLELGRGVPKEEAIVASAADVGTACFLTSATTFVGFLALTFVPTPAFRHFGFVVGFGVASAFVLAVTLVPIVLSVMKAPEGWRSEERATQRVQRILTGALAQIAALTTRRPWTIIIVFALLAVVSGVGAAQIAFRADMNQRLDDDNPIRRDQRYFERTFVGTATLDLRVTANEPGGVLDDEVFNRMANLEAEIEAMEEVDRVTSLVDVLRQAFDALIPPELGKPFLPLNDAQIAQLMLLLEDRPDAGTLDPIVNFKRQNTRLTIYSKILEMQAQYALGERIEALARRRLGDHASVEVYGSRHLIGSWIGSVLDGQRNGLIFSVIVIGLLMMIGLRSWWVGGLSIIPNLFPLLALGGFAGWAWDKTDTDTLFIAMIAIGIGVNDTIHFLARLRIEWDRAEVSTAIARTFRFSGRGIIITTAIFSVGFLPFALSDYYTVALFGTLLPGCFVVALATDLLLVPAMVRTGIIRFPRRSISPSETGD